MMDEVDRYHLLTTKQLRSTLYKWRFNATGKTESNVDKKINKFISKYNNTINYVNKIKGSGLYCYVLLSYLEHLK